MPDPACNPYLAFTAMLAAGLDGVKNQTEPPLPITGNVYKMSKRERSRLKIKSLPANLGEALDLFEKDTVLKEAEEGTVGPAVDQASAKCILSVTVREGPSSSSHGTLLLSPPIEVLNYQIANSSGHAIWHVSVPLGASGVNVWLQALDRGSLALSNGLAMTVQ